MLKSSDSSSDICLKKASFSVSLSFLLFSHLFNTSGFGLIFVPFSLSNNSSNLVFIIIVQSNTVNLYRNSPKCSHIQLPFLYFNLWSDTSNKSIELLNILLIVAGPTGELNRFPILSSEEVSLNSNHLSFRNSATVSFLKSSRFSLER